MAEILDACCGGRMWWWDKNHPLAVYMDKRSAPSAGSLDRVRPHFPAEPVIGTRSTHKKGMLALRWFVFYKPLGAAQGIKQLSLAEAS